MKRILTSNALIVIMLVFAIGSLTFTAWKIISEERLVLTHQEAIYLLKVVNPHRGRLPGGDVTVEDSGIAKVATRPRRQMFKYDEPAADRAHRPGVDHQPPILSYITNIDMTKSR